MYIISKLKKPVKYSYSHLLFTDEEIDIIRS